MSNSTFEKLLSVNVNSKVETKQNMKYLSWTFAWEEFKKQCPDANYEVIKSDNGAPYFSDSFGIMVQTKITANGETLSMWLPVLDSSNKAMKSENYTYKVIKWKGKYPRRVKDGFEDKIVNAATMFDINTTTMRCLVKNMAMFGLGLYLYSGEDMPTIDVISSSQMTDISNKIAEHNLMMSDMLKIFGISKLTELASFNYDGAIQWIEDNATKSS